MITFYLAFNPERKNPFKPVAKRGPDGLRDLGTAQRRCDKLNSIYRQNPSAFFVRTAAVA